VPTIPTYTRQVGEAPLPGVRVPTSAPAGTFDSPLAQALPAATQASAAHDKASLDFDEMASNSAERKLRDSTLESLNHPETGALNMLGVNALHAQPAAEDAFTKASSDIEGTLTSDYQKQLFAAKKAAIHTQMVQQVVAHTSAQLKHSDIETTKSFLQDGLNYVHADPAKADAAIADAMQRIVPFAQRQGWSPETLKANVGAHISDIVTAAIDSLSHRGTPEAADQAAAILAAHRKDLVGGQLHDAEKQVDDAQSEGAGLRAADAILGLNQTSSTLPSEGQQEGTVGPGGKKAAPISRVDALAKAEAIPDPKQRKAATEALMAHYNQVDRLQHLDRQDAMSQVVQQMEAQGGRLNRASPAYQKLIGHPEEEQILHRQDQILRPPKDPGDADLYLSHLNLAHLAPDEFAKLNFLKKDGEGLNTSQKRQLINLQRSTDRHDEATTRRDAAAATAHAVQSEQLRFQRENALLKAADIQDKAERDTEVSRIKRHFNELQAAHSLTAPPAAAKPTAPASTGDIDLRDPTAPSNDAPLPTFSLTQSQLERIARDRVLGSTRYEEYLKHMGATIPAVLPSLAPKAP
jgi:PAS domain-containing protein